MSKLAKALAVLSLLALSQVFQSAGVQASTVPISESSYVRITNYSASYLYFNFENPSGPPASVEWKGFDTSYTPYYTSIPTIEAKIIPPGSPGNNFAQNGLLFDCHSGYANVGDYASAMPVALCGLEPWTHVEFDWASNITAAAAPYLWLEVAGSGYSYVSQGQQVQWRMNLRAGSQAGHAVIDLPSGTIVDVAYLRLAVEPIPEPGSLISLASGLGFFALLKRKRIM